MKVYYKCNLKLMSEAFKITIENFLTLNDYTAKTRYGFNEDYLSEVNKCENAKEFLRLFDENSPKMFECFSSEEITNIFKRDLYLKFDSEGIDEEKIIFEIVESEDGTKYAKEIVTGLLFPLKGELYVADFDTRKVYVGSDPRLARVNAKLTLDVKYPGLAKCAVIITKYEIADKNEIDFYLKDKSNSGVNNKYFTNHVKVLYNKNVFNKDIQLKKDIEPQSTGLELSSISHIEYYLAYLDSIKDSKSIALRKEYSSLLKSINDKYSNMPVGIDNIFEFESRIKFYVFFNDKINYLSLEVTNLENSLFNHEEVNTMSFIEIDNSFNLFLKYKDIIELEEQTKILNNFSKLYLLSIIKDNPNKAVIESSHYKELLYLIVKSYNEYGDQGYFVGKILSIKLDANEVLDVILNNKINDAVHKKINNYIG